jgi:hypothetical protein
MIDACANPFARISQVLTGIVGTLLPVEGFVSLIAPVLRPPSTRGAQTTDNAPKAQTTREARR